MGDIIIRIENVSKEYRLGIVNTQTLIGDLNRWWARIRGKEDPALIVGRTNTLTERIDEEYVWALKDINLEVREGDVLGIIGKNGAGKSTLLKILSRVTSPTIGCIKIRGRVSSLLEVGTGFHGELTGMENIYLNGTILGMTKKEIRNKIDEIVAFSGIEKYIDTPVKRYSSGMYVRLAFAVAAHLEPDILIVDEVLAVGDAEFQKKALGKMNTISKQYGRTVLLVSHQLGMISSLCNNGILLENGELIFYGKVNSVIERYLSNMSDNKIRYYKSDKKNGKNVQIFEIKISGSKADLLEFDIYDQPVIEFIYEIRKPIKGLGLFFEVERNGQPLFLTLDTDTNTSLLEERKPGLYKSKLVMPRLKAGNYSFNGGLSVLNMIQDENRDVFPTLSITVNELNTDASFKSFSINRPGLLLTELNWETSKIINS